jgi:hypothetical protein
MKHLVTQHDYKTKQNRVIFSSNSLFEARQYLENTVFDYIVLKIGDKALQQKDGYYEVSTWGVPDVKGVVNRYIPKCLHRQYNPGSRSWFTVDTDYFAIRNPVGGSLFQMTVYKKDLSKGWVYDAINPMKIFDVDIITYDDGEKQEIQNEEESLFVDYKIREVFNNVLNDVKKRLKVEEDNVQEEQ